MQQSKANSISCTFITGGIQPSAPEGVGTAQFIGRLFRPYLSIYGYSETYEDESTNALKPMIDPKTVLLGCSKSPATQSFGSITQIEQRRARRRATGLKFVPRRLATPREDRVELRIASRPCLVPSDLSSWAVLKPLAGALVRGGESKHEERESRRREIIHERIYIIQSNVGLDSRGRAVPTTTYSLDIPASAVLKAGTFLTRAGAVAVTGATVFGVLAYEVDATSARQVSFI